MRLDLVPRFAWVGFLVVSLASAPRPAAAQDIEWGFEEEEAAAEGAGEADAGPRELDLRVRQPSRVLARLGAGVGLRLGTDEQFNQETLAPVFLEVMGGWVAPGTGRWRHGLTLHAQSNLTTDGSQAEEIEIFRQYNVLLSYLAYFRFGMDAVVGARIGPAFSIAGVSTAADTRYDWAWGGEVAFTAQYMLLAGLGLYVDVGVSVYAGGADSVNPVALASGGIVIDYELLP